MFFFFNDTATTEIYTLSLHDALPIFGGKRQARRWSSASHSAARRFQVCSERTHVLWRSRAALSAAGSDRKSTRLNSSHANISYAVFCLKKKKDNDSNQHLYNQTT